MPTTLDWSEIATRLALTILAGALVGINRTEFGRTAGLRTTVLVCLAASAAMIQTNLLMATVGKAPNSFVVMDVMRLPLGILTGMGFIGAGAILRRGEIIQGVTTAATLWLVTVIGLCLGGGQIGLGMATLVLALFVLWVLKRFEQSIPQDRRGRVILRTGSDGPSAEEFRTTLVAAGYRIGLWDVTCKTIGDNRRVTVRGDVHWRGKPDDRQMPNVLERLMGQPGVLAVRWRA